MFFIVIFCGAFVKCATTFGILRLSMGFDGPLFGFVFAILSFVFSLLVLHPVFERHGGLEKIMDGKAFKTEESMGEVFNEFFKVNTLDLVDEKVKNFAVEARKMSNDDAKPLPGEENIFSFRLAGFLVSELIRACELALLLLIPFLVIDLLVVNILAVLGLQNISQALISLPIKLALIVGMGAWTQVFEKLLLGYTFPNGGL
jgi:type III secretory pathway component EscR